MTTSSTNMIFCDFDGTITKTDNIIRIMRHFDPPGWEIIKDDILNQRISIRDGVGTLFSLLDTSQQDEIVRFAVEKVEIRSGFPEFVVFCEKRNIELLVISGGIDFFVYPILSRFNIPPKNIYCNVGSFSGEKVNIVWPYPCDEHCSNDCGLCKPSIIRAFKNLPDKKTVKKVVIGDSITDVAAAKQADLVIARELLLEKCKQYALPYREFHSFYDVIAIFQQLDNRGDLFDGHP
ncbi:2-hydroxy-3-keto-5-methylthiopentenyl-1-phosphate phosphatase [Fictibacillus sp. NRS-1165]|uniref:2-hydroxy-3-keto-5-methylthiopentenyl-1- phosphate phosphatase n=1 Tax=Fictibacillus sp. NRS-1165 TaxID=3144463 RepID=UPI003D21F20E